MRGVRTPGWHAYHWLRRHGQNGLVHLYLRTQRHGARITGWQAHLAGRLAGALASVRCDRGAFWERPRDAWRFVRYWPAHRTRSVWGRAALPGAVRMDRLEGSGGHVLQSG